MLHRAIITTGFLLLALLPAVFVSAQVAPATQPGKFDDAYQQSLARNPADLTFQISTRDGQTRYHIGQPIQLVLRFSTSSPGKYWIWIASGRTGAVSAADIFHVDPKEGTSDPFGGAQFNIGFYSGPAPYRSLEAAGLQSTEQLNESVRFDKPGHYRIYIESPRLLGAEAQGMESKKNLKPTFSTLLELEILPPDPQWLADQLQAASAILQNDASSKDARARAIQSLQTLQTEEATRLLLTQLSHPPGGIGLTDLSINTGLIRGLIMSPYRAAVIDEVKRLPTDSKPGLQTVNSLRRALNIPPGTPATAP